ncbi:hypothetical protein, partial [Bacillus pumilus]|uniref:hypothetical protein n=1 Tax=Bacillus pumilus TaxID=1408 RepID=UPI001C92EC2B
SGIIVVEEVRENEAVKVIVSVMESERRMGEGVVEVKEEVGGKLKSVSGGMKVVLGMVRT